MDYLSYPPIVYRMIASQNGIPIGLGEIVKRSGLSRSTIKRVSGSTWDNVRIGVYRKFVKGCIGDTPAKDVRRKIRILEQKGISGMRHLQVHKTSPLWRRGATGNTRKFLVKIISKQNDTGVGS